MSQNLRVDGIPKNTTPTLDKEPKNKRTTISNDTLILFHFLIKFYENSYLFAIAACAAASLAIGTRNGEQDT